MANTKSLSLLRNKYLQDIEKLKKEIYQIDEKIRKDGQIEDPTLLHSIEQLRAKYDKGDFRSMIPLLAKANEQLQADRYFIELKSEDVEDFKDLQRYRLPSGLRVATHAYYSVPMVIGGTPGARKTSVAVDLAYEDFTNESPFAFFSFELTMHQLFAKFLQQYIYMETGKALHIASLSGWVLNNPKQYKAFREKFFAFGHIIEAKGYSGARVVNVYERLKTANPTMRTCYIDYFQRIRPDVSEKASKDDTRIGYMNTSRYITDSCKGTDSVFVILSQMNADGGFKETGALLEDAGLAIVLEKKDKKFYATVKKDRFDGQWGEAELDFEPMTGTLRV